MKHSQKFLFLVLLVVMLAPAVALAQNPPLYQLINRVADIIRIVLIPLAFTAGLLAFFWGLAKFIWNSGSEDEKERGRRIMVWGIAGLFVMSAVWGLVFYIQRALGIQIGSGQNLQLQQTPNGSGGNGDLSLPKCGTVPVGIPCYTNNPFDLTPGSVYKP